MRIYSSLAVENSKENNWMNAYDVLKMLHKICNSSDVQKEIRANLLKILQKTNQ